MAKATQLINNEVFRAFATYAAIVLLKMMLMSLITAYFRLTRKVSIWKYWLREQTGISIEIQRHHSYIFSASKYCCCLFSSSSLFWRDSEFGALLVTIG